MTVNEDGESHSSYGTCFLSEEEENMYVKKNTNKKQNQVAFMQRKILKESDVNEST